MNKTRTICGLYTRVSSRNQADADYSSLETQRERMEAYCKSQNDYSVYMFMKMAVIRRIRLTARPSGRCFAIFGTESWTAFSPTRLIV